MRSKIDIESERISYEDNEIIKMDLILEVLLDIRDLLMKEKSGQFHLDLNEPNKEPDYSSALEPTQKRNKENKND